MKTHITFKNSSRGGIELFLLGTLVIGAFLLVGGTGVFKKTPAEDSVSTTSVECCNKGSGDACVPEEGPDKEVTFNNKQYGLLRSDTEFIEGNLHLRQAGTTPDGKPIIVNSSDDHLDTVPPNADPAEINAANVACGRPNPLTDRRDLYFKKSPTDPYYFMKYTTTPAEVAEYCISLPNDDVIFVCKENCTDAACSFDLQPGSDVTCYGNANTEYDVYFDLEEYRTSGVPDFIKNCSQKTAPQPDQHGTPPPQTVLVTPNVKHDNLQLNTFGVVEPGGISIPWFSPFCKPAVYLYPESQTQVSVKVDPVGPFTYTTPLYTKGGWNVTAHPDGTIISNGTTFPYLYYEADIPSLLIAKPEQGYIVQGTEVQSLVTSLGRKLGLNEKETNEMALYWQDALPENPYYFIAVIPESTLNSIAPLTISPSPTTTIRIALYFEAKDTLESVQAPVVTTPVRNGFTVVEWGGILKTDKPFVCLQ